ncbi:diacylglycerol kinase [Rhodococcus sp. HNM0569]|nr:diacylglycerol kinase [Rhodococcus sp. HNM0569]
MRAITLLTNPAAGHGNARHAAERAVAHFQRNGIEVVHVVGVDAADALRLARSSLDRCTDALVVAGGDGVISIALQALAGTDVPLGIVPAGTGNDHAREYAIPTGDPERAVEIVVAGHTTHVDLGRIEDADGATTWFGTVMASGFDSLVSDRTNRMTWPHGRMRYNLAILAELWNLRPLPFRLVLDDREIRTDLTLVAVGNTRSYGGGMRITPHADHADGLLDVTVVGASTRTRLVRLFPTVFRGTHVDLDAVTTYRARTVTVESPGISAYADGDYVGPLPVRVEAVPRALHILVPGG